MRRPLRLVALALFAAISFGCDSGTVTPADSSTAKSPVPQAEAPSPQKGKTGRVAKKSSMEGVKIPAPPKTRGDL